MAAGRLAAWIFTRMAATGSIQRAAGVPPEPFLLKHYPIRSQEHGVRKVLKERFRGTHRPGVRRRGTSSTTAMSGEAELSRRRCGRCSDPCDTAPSLPCRGPRHLPNSRNPLTLHERYRRKIVTSGGCEISRPGWEVIKGVRRSFRRNLNLGIAAAGG